MEKNTFQNDDETIILKQANTSKQEVSIDFLNPYLEDIYNNNAVTNSSDKHTVNEPTLWKPARSAASGFH